MLALFTPGFPWWEYLRSFTWFVVPVMIVSAAILLAYPSQIRKVALIWIGIGLFQAIFSGFYQYPYAVFLIFPNEVAYGLFALASGMILTTFSIIRTKPQRTKLLFSLFAFVLAAWGLYEFLNFAIVFPDFSTWNIWVNATPYLAFLVAAIVFVTCGALNVLLKKANP